MNPRERGFLLLTSPLGDPDRKILTTAQLRTLAERMRAAPPPDQDRDLEPGELLALGYTLEMAERIVGLLSQEDLLDHYLAWANKQDCVPLTWVSPAYPHRLKERLGLDAPGCLWARGDLSLLDTPMVSLVGSRELAAENREFAREVGCQAAWQGFTLVSGNARGADKTAQDACLEAGGRVISVVADELIRHDKRENVLYLSENAFAEGFSAQRALSRNRCIHALGEKTFVAQSSDQHGGTWDGTVKNLRFGWSPVFCFHDGSSAMTLLEQMGAGMVEKADLTDLKALTEDQLTLFSE